LTYIYHSTKIRGVREGLGISRKYRISVKGNAGYISYTGYILYALYIRYGNLHAIRLRRMYHSPEKIFYAQENMLYLLKNALFILTKNGVCTNSAFPAQKHTIYNCGYFTEYSTKIIE